MKNGEKFRNIIILTPILIVILIIIFRLYFLSIVHGGDYKAQADRQYVKSTNNNLERGSIFFQQKDGNLVSAGTLQNGFELSINPTKITYPNFVYDQIASVISIDKKTFIEKASKTTDPYEEISKKIDESSGKKLQALKITGVSLESKKWRFYPGGKLASNVLGFVGYSSDGNSLIGRYGLESYYQNVLNKSGNETSINFFAEIFSDLKKTFIPNQSLNGDIISTIEPTAQNYLEGKLGEINSKWSSDYSGGIIMDPKTGTVYAMAFNPTYDPNYYEKETNLRVFTNPLVESVYEMGSIVKPLTMAIGIDSGAISSTTKYFDSGKVESDGATIYNFDKKGRGLIPMQEILNQSLNTGASFVEQKVGNDKFATYMRNFGIGEKTNIDLPNEGKGIINNLKSPRNLEYMTASFGQGIAITPIETVRALSSLANDGKLPNPHIVKQINYDVGGHKIIGNGDQRQVITPESAKEVTAMLTKVVDTALLGGRMKLEHYSVAAKTGTAQVANPSGGGYYDNLFLHSFFGYFPATNPRFLIFLFSYNPKAGLAAAETLTPPFFDIVKFLANYYEIPPDR